MAKPVSVLQETTVKERKRPTTIAGYIQAAPREGKAHLRRMHALLKGVAPQATETIKWGMPYFVEPRFLFSFSAHRSHISFAPMAAGLEPFRKELEKYDTTRNFLRIPYNEPLPEVLIRKIARHSLRTVTRRKGDAFW